MRSLYNHHTDWRKFLAAGFGMAIAAFTLSACDDDNNIVQTPLQAPMPTCTESTWCSLSFEWTKVEGASQYSYILKDAEGNPVYGDVTSGTSASVGELDSDAPYTVYICAYPVIGSETATLSESATLQMKTGLINLTGYYESSFIPTNDKWNGAWNAALEESTYNNFVLKDWYGVSGYDLEFTVNPADSTINVLNGTEKDGYKIVPSGQKYPSVQNGVGINERASKFNRLGRTLTLVVKATKGTATGEDILTWE